MNTCTYQITRYKFIPKSTNDIEGRKAKFVAKLKAWSAKNDLQKKEYPDWLRKDFFEYWTEFANDNGRKMRFEMEKTWNTGRRLATAKRTVYAKDPRWKESVSIKIQKPKSNYSDIDYNKFKRRPQNQDHANSIGERLKLKFNAS